MYDRHERMPECMDDAMGGECEVIDEWLVDWDNATNN